MVLTRCAWLVESRHTVRERRERGPCAWCVCGVCEVFRAKVRGSRAVFVEARAVEVIQALRTTERKDGVLATKAVGTQGKGGVLATKAMRTQGKCDVLATNAVGAQGKGGDLVTKAVGTQGKGGVFATNAVETQGKGGDLVTKAVVTKRKDGDLPRPRPSRHRTSHRHLCPVGRARLSTGMRSRERRDA